jgi:aryl-alcohol dehydrogenase-like predicted oxidoreductase
MGPQSDHLSPAEGAALLLYASRCGVTFWDTADDYGTHAHIAAALHEFPRAQMVIASKTTDRAEGPERILRELGTDYVDILLVHEVSLSWADAAKETLITWQREKARGSARALGFATHSAQVARLAADWPEVEVLMLPLNAKGVCIPGSPIEDGGIAEMLVAAERAWVMGKGVVAMKVMGCGTLAGDPAAAIAFAAHLPYVHSLCIGMRSARQVEENVALLGRLSSATD